HRPLPIGGARALHGETARAQVRRRGGAGGVRGAADAAMNRMRAAIVVALAATGCVGAKRVAYEENDGFGLSGYSDRYNTQGLRSGLTYATAQAPGILRDVAETL